MPNNILLWIKGNYEKVILGILLILLIMISLRLFAGVDKNKELEDFTKRIKPPTTLVNSLPIDIPDLEAYLIERPFPQYQLLVDRDVFSSAETKGPKTSTPEMNLECTGVISDAGNVLSAALRDPRTDKTYKAKEGEKIENWTVVSITRDIVVLSGEDKQYRLKPPAVTMPFKLTGIMPQEAGFQAMLQSDSTKKTYFVSAGDKVENWEILSIDENKVTISRPDAGKYELRSGGEFQRIKE